MTSVFTKIINSEIPAYKVAENDSFIAFLDIFPVAKGHTLVVPKVETDYIFDLDEETYRGLHDFARKVAIGIRKAIPCKKVGMAVLGLEVPHAHIHLVPMQTEGDLLNFGKKLTLPAAEFEDIRAKIAAEIRLRE